MKRSIKWAAVVTVVTLVICYTGIRQELKIAGQAPAPATPIRLADSGN